MVINANGDPARFAPLGLPVVPDTIDGFVGPLAGVLAGMRWSAANAPAARWIVTAAGDAPLLPSDLVARLCRRSRAATGRHRAGPVARRAASRHRPVAGRARRGSGGAARASGVRKVLHWTDRHGTVAVPFPPARVCGLDIDPFFNANTPQELDQLRAMLAKTAKTSK